MGKELGWDADKVNVNGGADRHRLHRRQRRAVLTTLLYEMQRRDAQKGLATLCIGGGMGIALRVRTGLTQFLPRSGEEFRCATSGRPRGTAWRRAVPPGIFPPRHDRRSFWRSRWWRAHRAEFEAAYGPTGDWARLFARSGGFRGTELMRADDGSYLTLDVWRAKRISTPSSPSTAPITWRSTSAPRPGRGPSTGSANMR